MSATDNKSVNHYGITPILDDNDKLLWLEITIPKCPSFVLKINREGVEELQGALNLLMSAEADGTIRRLCPPRKINKVSSLAEDSEG